MKLKILVVVLSLSLSVFLVFRIKRELIIHRSLSYSLQQVNQNELFEFNNLIDDIKATKKKSTELDMKYEYISKIKLDTIITNYKSINFIDSFIDSRYKLFSSVKRIKSNITLNKYIDSLQHIDNVLSSNWHENVSTPITFLSALNNIDSMNISIELIEKYKLNDTNSFVLNQQNDTIKNWNCVTKESNLRGFLVNPVTKEKRFYGETEIIKSLSKNE